MDARTAARATPLGPLGTPNPRFGVGFGVPKRVVFGTPKPLIKDRFFAKIGKRESTRPDLLRILTPKTRFLAFLGVPPKTTPKPGFLGFLGFLAKTAVLGPKPPKIRPHYPSTIPPKTPQNPDTAPKTAREGSFLGRNLGACSMQEYPHRHPRI